MGGDENPFERYVSPLGHVANRVGVSLKLAEDDLVLTQKQRAAVLHRPISPQIGDHARDPSVERGEVGVVDTGPEALGDEAFSL